MKSTRSEGGRFTARGGSAVSAIAAVALVAFGGATIGALGLLAGPVDRLGDDLKAAAVLVGVVAGGAAMAHAGFAAIAGGRGLAPASKRAMIAASLLTTIAGAVLLAGFVTSRTGFSPGGRPLSPAGGRLGEVVASGLLTVRIGFALLAVARVALAVVAWSIRGGPDDPRPRRRRSTVLLVGVDLGFAGSAASMIAACRLGREAATLVAGPITLGALRVAYADLDLMLALAAVGAVGLIGTGIAEVALTATLPAPRTAEGLTLTSSTSRSAPGSTSAP